MVIIRISEDGQIRDRSYGLPFKWGTILLAVSAPTVVNWTPSAGKTLMLSNGDW